MNQVLLLNVQIKAITLRICFVTHMHANSYVTVLLHYYDFEKVETLPFT